MMLTLMLMMAATQPARGFDYLPRNTTGCQYSGAGLSLKPRWQISTQAGSKIEQPVGIEITNLEGWKGQLQDVKVDELAPRCALPELSKQMRSGSSGFCDFRLDEHRPWHLAIQRQFPNYFGTETVLYYKLIKKPTESKPYFEAVVCAMPNIRCRGKTLEQVKENLLKQYTFYLATLIDEQDDFEDRCIYGSRFESCIIIYDEAWNARLPLKSELVSGAEELRRQFKREFDRHGKDVGMFSPGYLDLIFPYGLHELGR